MANDLSMDQKFLEDLTQLLDKNIQNENFGVNELAKVMAMSRSQLHRKLKKSIKKSTSQFIREHRLEKAMEMLKNNIATASEIAYRVGFSSPTYFNKSFRDFYGYTPGEVKFRKEENNSLIEENKGSKSLSQPNKNQYSKSLILISALVLILFSVLLYNHLKSSSDTEAISIPVTEIPSKSIAILPFKNLSDDNENQYFADGVRDDLLNRLSGTAELKVISGITTEQFKDNTRSAPEIAEALGITYLLRASFQKFENQVKITIHLIDAKKDEQIWSKDYLRDFDDIFSLESDIAKQVAKELKLVLSPVEVKNFEKVPTKSFEAYNLYFLGKHFLNYGTEGEITKSKTYFLQAIEKDPEFAMAYTGLAEAIIFLTDSIPYAKELALRSLQLDNTIADAHVVLGYIACNYEWNWNEAEKQYKHAILLNPNSSMAYITYSIFLKNAKGSFKKARDMINKARYLEPLNYWAIMESAELYQYEGNFDEALKEIEKAKSINELNGWAWWVEFEINTELGDHKKAIKKYLENYQSIDPEYVKLITQAFDQLGIKGVFMLNIELALENYDNASPFVCFEIYNLAKNYAFLDDKEQALLQLEKAYDMHCDKLFNIKYEPYFKKYRTEPRFLSMLYKMNLGGYLQFDL